MHKANPSRVSRTLFRPSFCRFGLTKNPKNCAPQGPPQNLLRVRGARTPSYSDLLRRLRAAPNTFGKLSGPDRIFSNSQPSYVQELRATNLQASAVSGIASSSEPLLERCPKVKNSELWLQMVPSPPATLLAPLTPFSANLGSPNRDRLYLFEMMLLVKPTLKQRKGLLNSCMHRIEPTLISRGGPLDI